MAINSVDYSQKLSNIKEQYDNSLDEVRDSYRKKIQEQKEHSKNIREKRLNRHLRQKKEMENEFSRIKNKQEKFVSDKIRDIKNRYKKSLSRERNDFDRNRAEVQRDYAQRIEEISNGYKNSFDSMEQARKYEKERREVKTERNLASLQKQFDKSIQEIGDRNYQSEMEKNQEARDIRQKMREERNVYNEKLAKKNANWEAKFEELRNYKNDTQEEQVKSIEKKHERRLGKFKNELSQRAQEREDFAKWSADEIKKQIAKNKLQSQKVYEAREHHLRNHITNNIKEKSSKIIEKFQQRYNEIKSQMNRNAVSSDREIRNKMDLSKNFYAKELSDIEKKNMDKMESLRNDYVKEKHDALTKADETFRNDIERLRDKLDKKYFSKESSLKNQIGKIDHEKQRIIQFYENQLDKLKSAASKEFDRITVLAEKRRKMDKKDFIQNMRIRDKDFKRQVDDLLRGFDKKSVVNKLNQEGRTKKLITRYENILKEERNAYEKEMARKDSLFREEYKRLVNKLAMERESLIAQYEAKLEQTRHING